MDKMEARSIGINVLKVAGVVAVIVAIFAAGAATGSRFGRGRGGEFGEGRGSYGMMGGRGGQFGGQIFEQGSAGRQPFGGPGMMGAGLFGKGQLSKDGTTTARVFGVISKVENNQITITDNAGKSQIVYTLPTTVIAASVAGTQTEVSITTLKAGQSITAIGSTDTTSKQFQAQAIRVQ